MRKDGVIIVLDDYPMDLGRMVAALERDCPSFQVIGFDSERALETALESSSYEDVRMIVADAILGPLARGWTVLSRFRRQWPHIKRVLVSNRATREDLELAVNECGLDAFFCKQEHFSEEALVRIRELLLVDRATLPISQAHVLRALEDLDRIRPGVAELGNLYRNTIADVISFVFYPLLRSPRLEVPVADGTMSADIVYYNSAQSGVLQDIKMTSQSLRVVVEVKNSRSLSAEHFRQLSAYLAEPAGKCGFLVFRGTGTSKYRAHVRYSWSQGKRLFLFTESELRDLARRKISDREAGADFAEYLETVLREKCLQV